MKLVLSDKPPETPISDPLSSIPFQDSGAGGGRKQARTWQISRLGTLSASRLQ